jgi:hypothetical protein
MAMAFWVAGIFIVSLCAHTQSKKALACKPESMGFSKQTSPNG